MRKPKIVVSECLYGTKCRYDGQGYNDKVIQSLKDYVDIDVTPKELEEKLFSCGFEVEELIEVGKDISGVVVGLVEPCEPIPATHLS